MKRFSAPASVHPDPSRPPDDDDSDASLSDGSKKVKTAQSFESLFNSESLSDIILDVNAGESVFHAHKMIVGLKSERLAALITSTATAPADNSSKPVLHLLEAPECSAVFSRFLYFIYSGAVWLHRDYVVPLFKLSVKYGVNALATHCENYIGQLLGKCLNAESNPPATLPVSTVIDLYEEDVYREETKKAAFAVVARRFVELIGSDRWITCRWNTVRDLLRYDDCLCEENLILVAATDWMKKNRLQDKNRIQEILASIRYPRLPRRVLYHLYTTASFKNFPQVQDLIESAIRYHCFKDVPEAQGEFLGLQYRSRGKKSRHTVCGGETCPPHQQTWHLETCSQTLAEDFNDNIAEVSNSRDVNSNSHHSPHTCHTSRHFHHNRQCGHHAGGACPSAITSSIHSSPIAAVQPRVVCQTLCDSDTPDSVLHTHTQV
ncbi:BTB/POZ domain-containing protein 17-like [Physella acuta]|uniref:BTB/POZ domain-containing protein 17-like n=1 Tax=Physella acuta TaxID=109671 RepID=UPI0027DCE3D4|nr:BTB/POZ domain-containing protein 17-like [Physella acuta]